MIRSRNFQMSFVPFQDWCVEHVDSKTLTTLGLIFLSVYFSLHCLPWNVVCPCKRGLCDFSMQKHCPFCIKLHKTVNYLRFSLLAFRKQVAMIVGVTWQATNKTLQSKLRIMDPEQQLTRAFMKTLF